MSIPGEGLRSRSVTGSVLGMEAGDGAAAGLLSAEDDSCCCC